MDNRENQTRSHESKARILVVDDEPEVAGTIRAVLVHDGFEVEIAEDGRQALNLLTNSCHFGVVITDMRMPEMDGLELLRRIRQLKRNLPVIVMTGYATPEDGLQAIEEGACDYIPKPFKAKVLIKVIQKALEGNH